MGLNKGKKREGAKPEIIYLSELDRISANEDKTSNRKEVKNVGSHFIKVKSDDYKKYNEMIKEVNSGKVKWSFYAIDGDKTYHFFDKIK